MAQARAKKKKVREEDVLSPTQKLAALMILLGEDTSAEMLKSFDTSKFYAGGKSILSVMQST